MIRIVAMMLALSGCYYGTPPAPPIHLACTCDIVGDGGVVAPSPPRWDSISGVHK